MSSDAIALIKRTIVDLESQKKESTTSLLARLSKSINAGPDGKARVTRGGCKT
jgi:hypothetical protein